MILKKEDRLELILSEISKINSAKTPLELLNEINNIVLKVEDKFSGIENCNHNESKQTDGRMYPIEFDNVIIHNNGEIYARVNKQRLFINNRCEIALIIKNNENKLHHSELFTKLAYCKK